MIRTFAILTLCSFLLIPTAHLSGQETTETSEVEQLRAERDALLALMKEAVAKYSSQDEEKKVDAITTTFTHEWLDSNNNQGARYSFRPTTQTIAEYRFEDPRQFWIGVQCEPVNDVEVQVDNGRKVVTKGGLLVTTVTAESPAENGGIKTDDIIVYFNDNFTMATETLSKAIEDCEGVEAKVLVVRDGEFADLLVTPGKRVTEEKAQVGDGVYELEVDATANGLPKGYSATIEWAHGKDAVISVKNDSQKWRVKGNEVEKLPSEVQSFAWRALRPQTATGELYYTFEPTVWDEGYKDKYALYLKDLRLRFDQSESKWERVEAKLDELKQAIEELKKHDD